MRLFGWGKPDHKWRYEPVRIVDMRRQEYLADIPVRAPVNYTEQHQHRICTVCGVTQDKKVENYE